MTNVVFPCVLPAYTSRSPVYPIGHLSHPVLCCFHRTHHFTQSTFMGYLIIQTFRSSTLPVLFYRPCPGLSYLLCFTPTYGYLPSTLSCPARPAPPPSDKFLRARQTGMRQGGGGAGAGREGRGRGILSPSTRSAWGSGGGVGGKEERTGGRHGSQR